MIEKKIDWLQFSARIKLRGFNDFIHTITRKSSLPFYQTVTDFPNGVRMYSGNPNTDKNLFVLSGKVCESMQVDEKFCNRVIMEFNGTCSRLDIATTVDYPILDLLRRDREKINSRLYKDMKVISDGELSVETIYIGDMKKRAKKGIVRAYDKALEQGLDGILLHRMELELRQRHADTACRRLANGATYESVVNSKITYDTDWWRKIFGEGVANERFENIETETGTTEIENKMAWIMKQVVPSLQYVLDYDKMNGTHNFETIINKLDFD